MSSRSSVSSLLRWCCPANSVAAAVAVARPAAALNPKNGRNALYEFVRDHVGQSPHAHALGEIIYKAVRFARKGNIEDVQKIAAWAFLVVIAAAAVSGLIVRRRLDRLDLVAVLKRRE